jgi:PTS system mannose-specific IIB component
VGWVRSNGITMIIIVDDVIAKDPIQLSILGISAPVGIKVTAKTVDEVIKMNASGSFSKPKVMFVFTNPEPIVRLVKGGVSIQSINVGGMRFSSGKKSLTKAVSVDEKDIESFRELINMNIEVECRMFPSDSRVYIKSLI